MRFVSVYSVFKTVTGSAYLHLGLFVAQMIFLPIHFPEATYKYVDGPKQMRNAWKLVNIIRYSHLAIGLAILLT